MSRRERREADDRNAQAETAPRGSAFEELGFESSSDGDVPPRRRRKWPWILLAIFVLLVVVVVLAVVFALQALSVRNDMQQAKDGVSKVMPLIEEGDTDGVQRVAAEVLELTTSANETVSGGLWQAASLVPWVGANVDAVRQTAQATHVLVRDAMPLALELLPLANPENLKVEGGGINLDVFRDAQPQLPALRAAFDEAKTHIDRIDRDAIIPLVEQSIGQLVDIVDDATPAIAFAEENLPVVLSMLGGDGPREYALLFQNNAEIRSTGGNPGAGTVLRVDNGHVEMREDEQALRFAMDGTSGNFPQYLDSEEKMAIFESDTWAYSQNYTRPLDFADTASLIRGLWGQSVGGELDGVLSLDPVALSYMLRATGPVTVPGENEPVTADNAVKLLLSDTYERFGSDGVAADIYFANVASAIFSTVMSGGWDPTTMIEQLGIATDEQRIYGWFADESAQTVARDLGIDGGVAQTNDDATQTGIFLNDVSHSKLEYYLSSEVAVTCSAADRTLTTSITLHNSIPRDDLSSYTLGHRNSSWGLPRTTMILDVIGLALPGGSLTGSEPGAGDRADWDRSGAYGDREAKSLLMLLDKDETKTVSFTSTVPDGASAPLEVRYSPTVTQTPVTVDASCEEMFPAAE